MISDLFNGNLSDLMFPIFLSSTITLGAASEKSIIVCGCNFGRRPESCFQIALMRISFYQVDQGSFISKKRAARSSLNQGSKSFDLRKINGSASKNPHKNGWQCGKLHTGNIVHFKQKHKGYLCSVEEQDESLHRSFQRHTERDYVYC
jgi:hypothetical protein